MQPKELIKTESYTCVGVKEGNIAFALRGIGIKPLILLYDNAPELLASAGIYDKVIGKAAATVALLAGAEYVWGRIMSQPATEYLKSRGVPYGYEQLVEYISNRTQDGTCPLESAVASINEPQAGYLALKQRISELMADK